MTGTAINNGRFPRILFTKKFLEFWPFSRVSRERVAGNLVILAPFGRDAPVSRFLPEPDFQYCHVNHLSKSFKMMGHMHFFRFSGFSGFLDPESGNPDFSLSWRDPGVKPDPTVPHL